MAGRKADGDSWISDAPDKDGYYNAVVSMGIGGDGKPDKRHVHRKSAESVRKRVRELENERDAGKVTKKGRRPTVQQMIERHLNVTLKSRKRTPNTISSYRSVAENHIYPRWGAIPIDRLRDDQIEDGIAEIQASGLGSATVTKLLILLSSAYSLQVKRGNVGRNPCDTIDAPEPEPSTVAVLTEPEAKRVLKVALGRPNAARWSVGLAMGLREGEALGLRWEFLTIDVPEGEPGEMRVWWQLQRQAWEHGCVEADAELAGLTDSKQRAAREAAVLAACTEKWHKRPCPKRCPRIRASGRRHVCVQAGAKNLCKPRCTRHAAECPERTGGGLVFCEIKEKRRKTLPVPPELVVELREHRDAQRLQMLAADSEWEDYDLVFAQWNGRPIEQTADWREWSDILKLAGVAHRGTHGARHAAATILLEKGVALPVVQELLGHSDIRVTRGYVHVSSRLAQDAARRMGSMLRRPGAEAPKSGTTTGTATNDEDR